MKVRIDQHALIDLDAPTLAAYGTFTNGSAYWLVWCKHCRIRHRHGPAEGHREAHCTDVDKDRKTVERLTNLGLDYRPGCLQDE
jgi:hypothetical protein